MCQPELSFVLYRSDAAEGDPARHLDAILTEAQPFNTAQGITGALYTEAGYFFQWFEGPTVGCDRLRAKLLRDPRHSNMTVLGEGPLPARLFERWSMARLDRGAESLFDYISLHGQAGSEGTAVAIRDFLRMRAVEAA